MSAFKFACIIVYGVVLAAAVPAVTAQDSTPRRIALLIGNGDYNLNNKFDPEPIGNYVPDLRNPCRDTELIKRQLEKYGFEIFDYCNVDQKTFDTRSDSFSAGLTKLPKGSIVFVYYSGHGMQFHGRMFTVPVLFEMDPKAVNAFSDEEQFKFFSRNANDVGDLLEKLTDDKNVALIVAFDNCRDNPVNEKVAYNEAVSIRTAPNTLIQYATTPGDRAPDGDGSKGRNSAYAIVLGEELAKGGDIGDIMAQVSNRIWKIYDSGKRDTYAETNIGPAFAALTYTPLKVGDAGPPRKSPAETPPAPLTRKKKLIRDVYDGVTLDIIWCEGEGEEERFSFASEMARKISEDSQKLGVGRIMLKPLSEDRNANDGYNVHRNLMRYDVKFPAEKVMLDMIAMDIRFRRGNFLTQRGVGVGGQPTPNYVSAFICGRLVN